MPHNPIPSLKGLAGFHQSRFWIVEGVLASLQPKLLIGKPVIRASLIPKTYLEGRNAFNRLSRLQHCPYRPLAPTHDLFTTSVHSPEETYYHVCTHSGHHDSCSLRSIRCQGEFLVDFSSVGTFQFTDTGGPSAEVTKGLACLLIDCCFSGLLSFCFLGLRSPFVNP